MSSLTPFAQWKTRFVYRYGNRNNGVLHFPSNVQYEGMFSESYMTGNWALVYESRKSWEA